MPSVTEIKTERLILNPLSLTDIELLHNIWIKPEVRKYLWDDEIIPIDQTEEIVKKSLDMFSNNGTGLWKVIYLEQMVGFCGYWYFHHPPELQLLYGVDPSHFDKGIATEVARAMIKYGFEVLNFEKIVGSTDAPNLASIRVMEKVGMSFEKRVEKQGLDTIYLAISKQEFNR
jgi:[ribosomal protein S5]-alanine N-acetyltransferase